SGSHEVARGGAWFAGWKWKRQPMTRAMLAPSPTRWDRVVAPTRDAHNSRRPLVCFKDENESTVLWRGTDRLPLGKHDSQPPLLSASRQIKRGLVKVVPRGCGRQIETIW